MATGHGLTKRPTNEPPEMRASFGSVAISIPLDWFFVWRHIPEQSWYQQPDNRPRNDGALWRHCERSEAIWRRLADQFQNVAGGGTGLGAVLADFFEQRPVRAQVQQRIAGASVDVPAPQEVGHDEEVVLLPVEALAGDFGRALAFEHDVEATGGLTLPACPLARPQQLRRIVEGREHRRAIGRVHKSQGDPLIGIARLAAQPVERLADLRASVMKHRARVVADAALVRHETRQYPAGAIKPVGIAGIEPRLLRPRVALTLARNSSSIQTQSRNSISGKSRMSAQTTGVAPSLPWSCQVPFGVRIRSPRAASQRSPSMVV